MKKKKISILKQIIPLKKTTVLETDINKVMDKNPCKICQESNECKSWEVTPVKINCPCREKFLGKIWTDKKLVNST